MIPWWWRSSIDISWRRPTSRRTCYDVALHHVSLRWCRASTSMMRRSGYSMICPAGGRIGHSCSASPRRTSTVHDVMAVIGMAVFTWWCRLKMMMIPLTFVFYRIVLVIGRRIGPMLLALRSLLPFGTVS